MKTVILSVMLLSGFTLNAQSLKDLLYSGKLKKDSSGVIRKTDDLSSKIDTVQKTSVVQEAPKTSSTEKVKPPPPPPGTVISEGDTSLAAIEQVEEN
ncbi:MAG TPA: hypothetical protein VEB42_00755, partial [Chitinophagaceae bacterium]|nr:hypothetical protein [Chitinophagaceae bacterium]